MIGQTLSHYRITAALGAGGMGEVYRATDTKLGRDVAIKVLPSEVAEDAERLARFEREAQLLAALNHPNVGAIYGLEEADGKPFLVLELVEGEELQQRLERGPIPVDEAIEIARQIAEGLEAAHDKGVVHRDLKPANVKLTPDGKVKVLDFGLAKAWDGDPVTGSSSDLSQSPTLAHTGTQAGVILGTAAYMSPEQARGKPVDRRTDVWALGAVLWEMLTGRQLFGGDSVSDIVAAVLTREPDWSELPAATPGAVRRLLQRALERDVRHRLQAIGEARIVFEDPGSGPAEAGGAARDRPRFRNVLTAVAAGLALVAVGWLLKPTPDPRPQPVRRFDLALEQLLADDLHPPTISPDGTRILYASDGRLWVRDLSRLEPMELPGTEGAEAFFWSHDGTRIAYVMDYTLWKIPAGGGDASALTTLPRDLGASAAGAWTPDGRIVLAGSNTVGLLEVPEQGGEAFTLLELDEGETDFHEINALPDNRGLLFTVHRAVEHDTIALLSGGSRRTILTLEGEGLRSPVYSSSGHVLFTRETANPGIWALPFSLARLERTGEPFLVAPHGVLPSVSSDGTLAYVRQGLAPDELVWVDRSGQIESVAEMPRGAYAWGAQLSPDASRALVTLSAYGEQDVWSYDISRGTLTRLTFDAAEDLWPAWSADGERIVFTSQRGGQYYNIFSSPADGSGASEQLTDADQYDTPVTVSPDGRWLVFSRQVEAQRWALWKLALDGSGVPEPLLHSPFTHYDASLSPDGRWLAYTSDESGRSEIYIQSFPELGGKQQLSTEGGAFPRWSSDGRELFFPGESGMMAVGVSTADGMLHPTPPEVMYIPDEDLRLTDEFMAPYDVAPDGRFLMVREGESAITLVLNWLEEVNAMERQAGE